MPFSQAHPKYARTIIRAVFCDLWLYQLTRGNAEPRLTAKSVILRAADSLGEFQLEWTASEYCADAQIKPSTEMASLIMIGGHADDLEPVLPHLSRLKPEGVLKGEGNGDETGLAG